MVLKYIFDRLMALIGLLVLWPVILVVAILIKIKIAEEYRWIPDPELAKKYMAMLERSKNFTPSWKKD